MDLDTLNYVSFVLGVFIGAAFTAWLWSRLIGD